MQLKHLSFVVTYKSEINLHSVFPIKAASNLYSFNLTHCDFEDGSLMCGFTQNRDDTYDWQIDNTYPDHTLGSKMGEQLMNRHKKFPL